MARPQSAREAKAQFEWLSDLDSPPLPATSPRVLPCGSRESHSPDEELDEELHDNLSRQWKRTVEMQQELFAASRRMAETYGREQNSRTRKQFRQLMDKLHEQEQQEKLAWQAVQERDAACKRASYTTEDRSATPCPLDGATVDSGCAAALLGEPSKPIVIRTPVSPLSLGSPLESLPRAPTRTKLNPLSPVFVPVSSYAANSKELLATGVSKRPAAHRVRKSV